MAWLSLLLLSLLLRPARTQAASVHAPPVPAIESSAWRWATAVAFVGAGVAVLGAVALPTLLFG